MGKDSEKLENLSSPKVSLRREVVYPQQNNSGIGVMMVASAAMFFAVASSAFILRAKVPHRSCSQGIPAVVPSQNLGQVSSQAVTKTCGEPFYEENQDGSVSVYFDLCPSSR